MYLYHVPDQQSYICALSGTVAHMRVYVCICMYVCMYVYICMCECICITYLTNKVIFVRCLAVAHTCIFRQGFPAVLFSDDGSVPREKTCVHVCVNLCVCVYVCVYLYVYRQGFPAVLYSDDGSVPREKTCFYSCIFVCMLVYAYAYVSWYMHMRIYMYTE
jgi:hypothetical protein